VLPHIPRPGGGRSAPADGWRAPHQGIATRAAVRQGVGSWCLTPLTQTTRPHGRAERATGYGAGLADVRHLVVLIVRGRACIQANVYSRQTKADRIGLADGRGGSRCGKRGIERIKPRAPAAERPPRMHASDHQAGNQQTNRRGKGRQRCPTGSGRLGPVARTCALRGACGHPLGGGKTGDHLAETNRNAALSHWSTEIPLFRPQSSGGFRLDPAPCSNLATI
jgi:hypothetical protein